MILKQALIQSHNYVKSVVQNGDCVVDATMGNGYDTVFLAELAGDAGKVYAFDVQECALENTRKKLEQKGLAYRCVLIRDGHENMHQYINEPLKLVLFNLGYLPGGDHNLCTRGETTVQAVRIALNKLAVHGLVILVIYHGGDSGFSERDYLLNELPKFDNRLYAVMMTEFINLPNNPPILVCIEKLKP